MTLIVGVAAAYTESCSVFAEGLYYMAWACPLEQVFVFAAARLRLSLSGREVKCYCISHCIFDFRVSSAIKTKCGLHFLLRLCLCNYFAECVCTLCYRIYPFWGLDRALARWLVLVRSNRCSGMYAMFCLEWGYSSVRVCGCVPYVCHDGHIHIKVLILRIRHLSEI